MNHFIDLESYKSFIFNSVTSYNQGFIFNKVEEDIYSFGKYYNKSKQKVRQFAVYKKISLPTLHVIDCMRREFEADHDYSFYFYGFISIVRPCDLNTLQVHIQIDIDKTFLNNIKNVRI